MLSSMLSGADPLRAGRGESGPRRPRLAQRRSSTPSYTNDQLLSDRMAGLREVRQGAPWRRVPLTRVRFPALFDAQCGLRSDPVRSVRWA